MINERTIENLVDTLEETCKFLEEPPENLPPDYIKRLKWLIYDVRADMSAERYDFDGLVAKWELDEAKKRIEELEDEDTYLD